jgi:hypothetical protein
MLDRRMEAQVSTKVGLFFLRPSLGGGSTTFTAHLVEALRAAGADPVILRVGQRSGNGKRKPFGEYPGIEYERVDPVEARRYVKTMPTLMTAPIGAKDLPEPDLIEQLVALGMRTVIHDPNEFEIFDYLQKGQFKFKRPPFCIRPTMHRFYPEAVFIPHPYSPVPPGAFEDVKRGKLACSTARIASVKRPRMLLDANMVLQTKQRVQLRGAEYRMFTYNLMKKYPPDIFKQSGGEFQFPKSFEAPVRVAAEYKLNFDMTWFPDDGGGTQYAQMEAMNAGTVNVMHEDWWRFGKGEMVPGKHVLTISDVSGIVQLLKHPPSPAFLDEVNANCATLLKRHAPKVIGQAYMKELT